MRQEGGTVAPPQGFISDSENSQKSVEKSMSHIKEQISYERLQWTSGFLIDTISDMSPIDMAQIMSTKCITVLTDDLT